MNDKKKLARKAQLMRDSHRVKKKDGEIKRRKASKLA